MLKCSNNCTRGAVLGVLFGKDQGHSITLTSVNRGKRQDAVKERGLPSFLHLWHLQNSTEYVGEELADNGR